MSAVPLLYVMVFHHWQIDELYCEPVEEVYNLPYTVAVLDTFYKGGQGGSNLPV